MLKILRKFAILGALSAGLIFLSTNSQSVKAYSPYCPWCDTSYENCLQWCANNYDYGSTEGSNCFYTCDVQYYSCANGCSF